jgi:hypothetical protein
MENIETLVGISPDDYTLTICTKAHGRSGSHVLPFLIISVDEKVYANTSQCADSPGRILLLFPGIQLAEEVLDEPRISVLQDGFSGKSHQVQLIVDVVYRE